MCARVNVCSDLQYALGSTCTRIKRSRCARIKTLEELAPESLDEGLGLPLPFSTFLFLPLTPPLSPNFAMDDPSGESWGDLDLFMSWNWRFGYSGTIRGFLCSHRRMPLMITTIVPQIFHLLSLDFFFMDSLPPNASPALS